MKNKISLMLFWMMIGLNAIAQNPREIHQQDKGYKNIWTSPESLMIAGAVILGIIIAKWWSKRAHEKRDEYSKKS